MTKGDKVRLKGRSEVTGEIIDTRSIDVWGAQFDEFLVKYDDKDLIPQEDWHTEEHLEPRITVLPKGASPVWKRKCECGVKFSRHGGKHSDYCPLYEKE